ncbi:hypothetical protein NX059_008096 [Plenodomus lindquistii]|nr:hypothetical protein NX059_008096 [Plenodomus lindquistii]
MSSESTRKHRAPFIPINTFSSAQRPSFKPTTPATRSHHTTTTDNLFSEGDSSFSGAAHVSYLGDSSSLFEESETASPALVVPTTSRAQPARGHRHTKPTTARYNNMVREREAPASQPLRRDASALPAKPTQELRQPAPQFGETSPLRNPLKKDPKDAFSNLFNNPKPGQLRPEHQQSVRLPSQYSGSSKPPPAPANPLDTLNRPFQVPKAQVGSRRGTASSTDSDVFEIPASHFQPRPGAQDAPVSVPRPYNAPPQTTFAPPRPVYSSMGHSNGFQPVNKGTHNPLQQSRQTVLLDDEDNFDPDAALRAEGDKFGAPDMYAYVDQGAASENIKALLEGAFESDSEKIPRTRGRKKKKQQEAKALGTSLADRLAALEVKDHETNPEAKEEEEDDEEEDDGTVDGLKVKLLPHQVDGVAWMIEKETGNHNKRAKLPKGGILADDMGLGKTVQSIALILSNPRPEKGVEPENKKNKISDATGKGTLVVAPLALIKQWEAEINSKVSRSHELKVLVHHGPNRTKSADKLKQYDVVITTYQVLASEHASCGDGPDGLKKGCFAVHWYRTMLDEAHTIKNRSAKMTKASYELRSHYRWCLTGTPMQNNLDELQSLIKFLRIQPYCEMSSWKESISGPMKNGRGNLAMRRLQIFLKAFMKRRTKDVLKKEGALNFGGKAKNGEDNKGGFHIVARNVETIIGEFTAKERAFYDRLSDRAQSRLDEMMGGQKQDYIGALVLLLRLRQACNHPNLTKSNVKDDKDAMTTGSTKPKTPTGLQTPRKGAQDADADDLADLLGAMSVAAKRCDICQISLNDSNAAAGGVRCDECEGDLHASAKKPKKSKKDKKKHREHKHKRGESSRSHDPEDDDEDEEEDVKPKTAKSARQRPVVVDSDDEEGAEWIASGDEHAEDLGQAGGTDDENAEGGGDTLASVDSQASASVDDSKSNLDSFIVHDTDSEDEAPIARPKQSKKPTKVISLDTDDSSAQSDSDSDSDSEEASEDDTDASEPEYDASDLVPSTKIRQLLSILKKETPDHKVIVFSQFTSMLNLIEPFLKRADYNFTRYDGSMRNDLREASLARLRDDKRTRILLCSLKCGSLGLNLTAASRVVIMEPFWNPFVEEQAIDRVHRLNQTIDVTVYRLLINNSVEERIQELQEAKRKLANAAIEGGKAMGKLSMKDVMALFRRDAEYETKHHDQDVDEKVFGKMRVLEGGAGASGVGGAGDATAEKVKRKAGSLGFRRDEGSVYGRR